MERNKNAIIEVDKDEHYDAALNIYDPNRINDEATITAMHPHPNNKFPLDKALDIKFII